MTWGINIKDAVYLLIIPLKTAQILLQEAESQLLLEEEAAKVQAVTYYLNILNGEKDYNIAQKPWNCIKFSLKTKKKWEEGNASSIDLLKAQENLENSKFCYKKRARTQISP